MYKRTRDKGYVSGRERLDWKAGVGKFRPCLELMEHLEQMVDLSKLSFFSKVATANGHLSKLKHSSLAYFSMLS